MATRKFKGLAKLRLYHSCILPHRKSQGYGLAFVPYNFNVYLQKSRTIVLDFVAISFLTVTSATCRAYMDALQVWSKKFPAYIYAHMCATLRGLTNALTRSCSIEVFKQDAR